MNRLQRILFEPPGGMFREFQGLTTHFKPRDAALYRDLLPGRFGMPGQPVVTIFVADYIEVHTWPVMSRYREWSVLLKAECGGEAGWFSLTMPVTRWIPMLGGRYLGFPKYVTDEITFTKQGDTRVALARHRGVLQLMLQFHSGATRRLEPWEQELAECPSFFKGDSFQLVPPGRGTRAQRIILRHVVPPSWSPELGMACVQAASGESWKGLIPHEAWFPATYNHFIGGFDLIAAPLA